MTALSFLDERFISNPAAVLINRPSICIMAEVSDPAPGGPVACRV